MYGMPDIKTVSYQIATTVYCIFLYFSEERQARNLKQMFGDFVYGNFPGNLQWRPYTLLDRYYYEIDGAIEGLSFTDNFLTCSISIRSKKNCICYQILKLFLQKFWEKTFIMKERIFYI